MATPFRNSPATSLYGGNNPYQSGSGWQGGGYNTNYAGAPNVYQSANNAVLQGHNQGQWRGAVDAPGGPFQGMTGVYSGNGQPAQSGGGYSQQYAPQMQGPPAVSSIGSQINPTTLYSPAQTASAISQQAADIFTNADPKGLLKQFTRPGISRDEGTLGQIAPMLGQANASVTQVQQAQPLLDQMQNQQHLLRGQHMQAQEGLGLANVMLGQNANQQRLQQGTQRNLLDALSYVG